MMARTEDLAKKNLAKKERNHSSSSSSSSSKDAAATEIDHISCLPDYILSTILYLLPTQIAARTALLSPQWRCIWADHPLRLDGDSISSLSLRPHGRPGRTTKGMHGKDWRSCLITDILTSHPGPVEQFRLAHTHSGSREPLRDSWFQILAQKHVYQIELDFPSIHRRQDLPASLLACETLSSLSLSNCRLPDTAAGPFNFLQLTDLSLCCMELTEEDYCSILSGCPALARLSLIQNSAIPRIRIRSRRLLTMTIGGNWIGEVLIEDAKKLTQLVFKECSEPLPSLKITNAPMIKTVECLSDYRGVQEHS